MCCQGWEPLNKLHSGLWAPINLKYRLPVQTEWLSRCSAGTRWWWVMMALQIHEVISCTPSLKREPASESQDLNDTLRLGKGRPDLLGRTVLERAGHAAWLRWGLVRVPRCTRASPHPSSSLLISLWLGLCLKSELPLCFRDLRLMNWELKSIF